jgi:hypothetical protein
MLIPAAHQVLQQRTSSEVFFVSLRNVETVFLKLSLRRAV